MVDALLEHATHLIVHEISVRTIGRPQQRWDEIWCIARQKLHGVTSSVSWSIVLLESEEVSCYDILHIGNFCFWVPFLKQLLVRNCAVDFVEICNVYVGKMIIKAAKRIFNSDKIYCSYSDLNFGVIFWNTVYKCLPEWEVFTLQKVSRPADTHHTLYPPRCRSALQSAAGGNLFVFVKKKLTSACQLVNLAWLWQRLTGRLTPPIRDAMSCATQGRPRF